MLSSFRSRLVLSNLVIALVGLLIVAVVFIYLLIDRSTAVKRADRADQSRAVAVEIHELYRHNASSAELHQAINLAGRLLGARIIVVSADGARIVVDSAGRTPYFTGSWRQQLDRAALDQARAARHSLASSNVVVFQSPIQGVNRKDGGAVLLVARVTDVRPDFGAFVGVILAAAGTALLVWLLIGFYFTYSVSRPLLRITEATERMARGDYRVRVPLRGPGEIARLAASFNGMAEQVQRSNQVLKDFVANVSHDLRTPLTMIAGFSQALLDGTVRQHEARSSAEVIHEEAGKMQQLVDDLLQLTRLESGLLKLDRHPVALRGFVQHILDRIERAATGESHAVLRNEVAEDLPHVDVDPVQLERSLRNLLTNALEYTPPSGGITVGAARLNRQWIEVTVADTGCGIPDDDVPRIFERFYRSDRSRERAHGHSGLGLAIVREIVEAHGGHVSVDTRPERGTTFRLSLPVASPAAARRATAASETADVLGS
jgi:signal transduction histidine kinase